MIRGQAPIREAYRDEGVARAYVQNRFTEPLGALLHRRQVEVVTALLRQRRPARVLELAPGPARLTVETAPVVQGALVVLDASRQMLAEARRRLAGGGAAAVRAVQGDAFNLPLGGPFDLVYTFRLIRHFELEDRLRIYRELHRVLRPGGLLVFDAVNEPVSMAHRRQDPSGHVHYDALLDPARLADEVSRAGFVLDGLRGVQHNFPLLYKLQVLVAPRSRPLAFAIMRLVDRLGGAPMEWVVTCHRG